MNFDLLRRRSLSRRELMKNAAAAGVGLTSLSSLSVLAACGGSGSSGPATIKVSDGPATNDKDNWPLFARLRTEFEKQNPNYKIQPDPYWYLPDTFYPRIVANKQDDATRVYFTEPQNMIQHGFVADITDQLKSWKYFSSISQSALKIISDKNGRIFALPTDGYKQGLVYSRKLFQKAGLDPDKPPLTWDDFMAYAKQISDKIPGVKGYMEDTTNNTGGWRFTNWLYTAGGRAETNKNGTWVPTFNGPEGVAVLNMYKKMRWTDHSMSEKVLVNDGDPYTALGQGKVAMVTGGTTNVADLHNDYQTPLTDFGVGPMPMKDPSNPDAGCLGGGNCWIFKKTDSADVLQGAVNWIIFYKLDLGSFEDQIKANAQGGKAVGYPDDAAFTGEFQNLRMQIIKKYANVPPELTKPYFDAKQQMVPEPPILTQSYYSKLDSAVQKILGDQTADPQKLLDDIASSFANDLSSQSY